MLLISVAFLLALLLGSLGMLNSTWTITTVLSAMGLAVGMTNVYISAGIMQRIDASVRGASACENMLRIFPKEMTKPLIRQAGVSYAGILF